MGADDAIPLLMVNEVRGYDWGSRVRIAELQGRPPAEGPEAELWMGTHPGSPSQVVLPDGPIGLDELIAADMAGTVGPQVAERFGARLPFLLKILAIEKALSVQVHPDADQAREGYEAEQGSQGPRTWTDPYPKPEMLYAVTDVEALAGLRPADEALALLARLDVPALDVLRATLRDEGPVAALARLAGWADPASLVEKVRDALPSSSSPSSSSSGELEWVRRLIEQFPQDSLVLAPLLLTLVSLPPGGTFYIPAGVPHAYLSGTAVEIMSESDNVVRAGLTSKPVDVEVLLELLVPGASPLLEVPAVPLGPGETVFRPPVEHFELVHLVLSELDGPVEVADVPGPQVVLCLKGEVEVAAGGGSVRLNGGHSAFVPVSAGPVSISGHGEVFRALPADLQ